MDQLSKEDKKVVEWWWKESESAIFRKGFNLDKFSFSFKSPPERPESRSFREILESGVTIVRCSPFFWLFLFNGRGSRKGPYVTTTNLLSTSRSCRS